MAKQTTRLRVLNQTGPVPINPATEETLVNLLGFDIPPYDYIGVDYPINTTEVYTYRDGGVAGTVVATITVVYLESAKTNITSVAKT